MDTPSLTPLDAGLRCDAPAACPSPDQVRTFLDALASPPTEAPAFTLPAANQPATPETLRTTLETLAATQASFAQSVADFQKAAAPLLGEAPAASLFLPKTEVPAASAPGLTPILTELPANLVRVDRGPGPGVEATPPGFILDPARVDRGPGPGAEATPPGFILDPARVEHQATPATLSSLAEAVGSFEHEQSAFAESVAELQAAMAPILAMPIQSVEPPQATVGTEAVQAPARVSEVSPTPSVSPAAEASVHTPQPLPAADLATTLRDFAATQAAFAESSQALQSAIATFLAQVPAPATEPAPVAQSVPHAEAPELATTLRDFAAAQAAFAESVAAFQEVIRPILAQQVMPEATAMPAERAAVPIPEQPKVARVAEVPTARAEAPAREERSAPGEVKSAKVVFMAMEPSAPQTAPVQSAPQTEAATQTQSTAASVREALPAAVTEAVEAVARALVVEPSGTVVVRLSEQTLAGSEVRLEVREGKLEVAFAPATGEVRELLVQQQGALTAQLVERFAGRWQVAVTIGELWRRKEEASR